MIEERVYALPQQKFSELGAITVAYLINSYAKLFFILTLAYCLYVMSISISLRLIPVPKSKSIYLVLKKHICVGLICASRTSKIDDEKIPCQYDCALYV